MTTDFERIGGEAALRPIIDAFVDRCFDDLMIGFHFRRASRERVKHFEYEHAAEHLGAPVRYSGRPIQQAHGPHAIFGGHFERRLVILGEVLERAGVPADVKERWLETQRALRAEVTADRGSECDEGRALERSARFRAARRGE
ncbi:MAG: group 1 truncated hemoglobin [Myxococcales bacterium]|nr:group 1 truncated hemoglobin [Myxococcales bacterium]